MRIIAGEYRHRLIAEVPGSTTRPTTDRNREMLFNILGQFFEEGVCLDLFAGSGAIGIEALSRGFKHSVFVDQAFPAIQTITNNLNQLKVPTSCFEIIRDDALHAITRFTRNQFDFIYLDPPYASGFIPQCLERIAESNLLAENGILCAESDKSLALPDQFGSLMKTSERLAGNTKLSFYEWRKQE